MSRDSFFTAGLISIIDHHVDGVHCVKHTRSLKEIMDYDALDNIDVVITELHGEHETLADTISFYQNIRVQYPELQFVLLGENIVNYSMLLGIQVDMLFNSSMSVTHSVLSMHHIHRFYLKFHDVKNPLTKAESNVMRLYCSGASTFDISDSLQVSPKTIHIHRSNVFKKLQIKSKNFLPQILGSQIFLR
jgi:DNA-binding NarL/FixJ family response regulator